MIKVVPFDKEHIGLIVNQVKRNQLQYNEYSFIGNVPLVNSFKNRVINSLKSTYNHSFALFSGTKFLGFIICSEDNFDSENFGFSCYRITDLLIFSENYKETNNIICNLLFELERKLASISRPYYITFGLSNNVNNFDQIFNSIVNNKFYYIHTLLTFSSLKQRFESASYYPEEKLSIRIANESDAPQVANLAQKSFKLSRFHLDPFLDKTKASLLLKKSAENSILQGFVDIMFIAEINNKIVGYYSGKKRYLSDLDKTIGDATISAVDSNYRGLGIFSKMDAHLLNWFAENTDFAEMGTYLANYPVHKAWINKKLGLIRGVHQFSKFVK